MFDAAFADLPVAAEEEEDKDDAEEEGQAWDVFLGAVVLVLVLRWKHNHGLRRDSSEKTNTNTVYPSKLGGRLVTSNTCSRMAD